MRTDTWSCMSIKAYIKAVSEFAVDIRQWATRGDELTGRRVALAGALSLQCCT